MGIGRFSSAHMKNPKIPAIHLNTRFIVTSKEWFGGGMDVTLVMKIKNVKLFCNDLKRICLQNKKNYKNIKSGVMNIFIYPIERI